MRAVPVALAALLGTAFLVVGGDGATAKPQLRIGYVVAAGTVPSEHNLFGLPLLGFVRAVKKFDVQGRVVYVSPNQDPAGGLQHSTGATSASGRRRCWGSFCSRAG